MDLLVILLREWYIIPGHVPRIKASETPNLAEWGSIPYPGAIFVSQVIRQGSTKAPSWVLFPYEYLDFQKY